MTHHEKAHHTPTLPLPPLPLPSIISKPKQTHKKNTTDSPLCSHRRCGHSCPSPPSLFARGSMLPPPPPPHPPPHLYRFHTPSLLRHRVWPFLSPDDPVSVEATPTRTHACKCTDLCKTVGDSCRKPAEVFTCRLYSHRGRYRKKIQKPLSLSKQTKTHQKR